MKSKRFISILLEAKEDIEKFVNKYGRETFDLFQKSRDRLKNHGYSTDILYWWKNDDKNELPNILDNLLYAKARGNKDSKISTDKWRPRGNYKYLGQHKGYDVYKVNDYIASMDLGINTGWCTTGRYGHYGDPRFVPSEKDAKEHFNEYTKEGIILYYLLDPKTHYGEYAFAIYPKKTRINKSCLGKFIKRANFELFNAQDDLDYTVYIGSDRLPIGVIERDCGIELSLDTVDLSDDNRAVIENGVLTYFMGTDAEYTIPDNVTCIGALSFEDCKNIKKVVISNSVTKIESLAFVNCVNLTDVIIGDNVKIIGYQAFSNCEELVDVEIPGSVVEIQTEAFKGCHKLKNVSIRNKATHLEADVFAECSDQLKIVKGGVPYNIEESLNMRREIRKRLNRSSLQEGVSADNPYLSKALDKYKKNTSFEGIVVSVKDNNGEHEINKLYKTNDDLKKIIQEIERKYPRYYDISAIHDRSLIPAFEKSLEDYKNTPKGRYSSSQLNQMRRNNGKILKAVEDAGLDSSKLASEKTDKRGRSYKKATPELNKLRKNLFGESIMRYKRLDRNNVLKEEDEAFNSLEVENVSCSCMDEDIDSFEYDNDFTVEKRDETFNYNDDVSFYI